MELDTSNWSLTQKCSVLQKGNECVYICTCIYASFLCRKNNTGLTSPSLPYPRITPQTINCSLVHVGWKWVFLPSKSCSKIQRCLDTAMKELSACSSPVSSQAPVKSCGLQPGTGIWTAGRHSSRTQLHSWNCLGSSPGTQTHGELLEHPVREQDFLSGLFPCLSSCSPVQTPVAHRQETSGKAGPASPAPCNPVGTDPVWTLPLLTALLSHGANGHLLQVWCSPCLSP